MVTTDLQLPIQVEKLCSILRKHGVISASLFGSYARGEARIDSDLDLLVHLRPSSSLFDLLDLQSELETATHRKVDVATELHLRFEPYITQELVPIL